MNTEFSATWVPFYMELADKLAAFKDDRASLINTIETLHATERMRLPKLEEGELRDIDPFTVFGLFNKHMTDANRVKLATGFKKAFGIDADVPNTFDGIPLFNNQSATMYRFGSERGDDDIENLWQVFLSALRYSEEPNEANGKQFAKRYDVVLAQKGVKWNLTMGLFWIRPLVFVTLDGRSRWGLTERQMLGSEIAAEVADMKDTPPQGDQYLRICDLCKQALARENYPYASLPEFSAAAWFDSEEENERIKKEKAAAEHDGSATMGDEGVEEVRYWLYSPGRNAEKWDDFYERGIMGLGWQALGDLGAYPTKNEIVAALEKGYGAGAHRNDAHALWQFSRDMNVGDIVYVKRGMGTIVGRGTVTSDYEFDDDASDGYPHTRSVEWDRKGAWVYPGTGKAKRAPMKTLTDITPQTTLVENMIELFEEGEEEGREPVAQPSRSLPAYTKDDFLAEVFLDADGYESLISLLRHKKNVVLQGAPGVGKTFMAKCLAYSLMGVKDPDRVELVQFHQSYAYEDFIMGYRPSANGGFELKTGAFYDFCEKAREDDEQDYFFIIDEINRGNLSKVFGELFMLIEPDKRGASMRLLYSDERFSVPDNVYLIGMMNTADRSLAMLDYALRRRFAFYEVQPAFDSFGFKERMSAIANAKLESLLYAIQRLNDAIADDDALGRGFRIGHSYFCSIDEADVDRSLSEIVDYELAPLLEEYWFDDVDTAQRWIRELRNAIR